MQKSMKTYWRTIDQFKYCSLSLCHALFAWSAYSLVALCDLSAPTQLYTMRIILDYLLRCRATHDSTLLISKFLFIFFCATHTYKKTHTHSYASNTPPSAFAAYKFNFLCSVFRLFLCALAARACVASFVWVWAVWLPCFVFAAFVVDVVVVVVAASSSWLLRCLELLLYARSFAYKFQHYLKVVLCPFCVCSLSLSLSLSLVRSRSLLI